MKHVYFDASALAQRYAAETGTMLVNEVFALVSLRQMACSHLGVLEVLSILLRKQNDGRLSRPLFEQAMTEFQAEVVDNGDFTKTSVNDDLLKSATVFLAKHNLNATDTVILRSALNLQARLRQEAMI